MMTLQEKKKFLSGYSDLARRVTRLSDDIAKKEFSRSYIEKALDQAAQDCIKIEEIIKGVNEAAQRELLYSRYIEGMTLENLALKYGYSSRHLQRIINVAVDSLQM